MAEITHTSNAALLATHSISGLILGQLPGDKHSKLPGLDGLLTQRYAENPATILDLSDGLTTFIKTYVTDSNSQAHLLAQLQTLQEVFGDGEDDSNRLVGSLLNGESGGGSREYDLINLLA